jgi:DNA invertase Pin-like site-specific DNA recombinase
LRKALHRLHEGVARVAVMRARAASRSLPSLASIANLEREKIRERTLAGLARARKQGRIGGRPRADEDGKLVASVKRLREAGKSICEIAAALEKSPTTIQRLVKCEAA